jgi:aldose 1-epimerase
MFHGPVKEKRGEKDALKFTYLSPDGDGKFPGTVDIKVWYIEAQEIETLGRTKIKKNVLIIKYEVSFAADENSAVDETAVHITNHRYVFLCAPPT